MPRERCPMTIGWGTTPTSFSRCHLTAGHNGGHEAPGLAQYPDQRFSWFPGDRREWADGHPPPWPWPWLEWL